MIAPGALVYVISHYAAPVRGRLLYAYTRPHAVADDNSKIVRIDRVPGRCGVRTADRDVHFTNGFEIREIRGIGGVV